MDENQLHDDIDLAAILKAIDGNTAELRKLREEVSEDADAVISAVTSAGNAAYAPYGAVGIPDLIDGIWCRADAASHELRDIRAMLEQALDGEVE